MKTLNFKLNIVTPMFLGGVDKLTAETRPPSLKGILRYWYRILVANRYDYDWRDYRKWKGLWEEVRKDESKLFGSQEVASRVRIRIDRMKRRLSHDDAWISRLGKFLSYIGYGPILYVNPNNPKYKYVSHLYKRKGFGPVRGYFLPGQSFLVRFQLENRAFEKELVGLLWFVSMFGSLGARSRKGLGSFYLQPLDSYHGFSSWEFDEKTFSKDMNRAMNMLGIEKVKNLTVHFVEGMDIFRFNDAYRSFMQERNITDRNYFGLPRRNKLRRASPVHFKHVSKGLLIIRKLEPFMDPKTNVKYNPNTLEMFMDKLKERYRISTMYPEA